MGAAPGGGRGGATPRRGPGRGARGGRGGGDGEGAGEGARGRDVEAGSGSGRSVGSGAELMGTIVSSRWLRPAPAEVRGGSTSVAGRGRVQLPAPAPSVLSAPPSPSPGGNLPQRSTTTPSTAREMPARAAAPVGRTAVSGSPVPVITRNRV